MQKILITGGSGLIGKVLANELTTKSYKISILGRKNNKPANEKFDTFYWDINTGFIDTDALKDVDCIVHLAGENISKRRWTKKQKIVIENSRVKSLKLIYQTCLENNLWPNSLISSSAIGYYGTFTSDSILTENDLAGNDFLALIGKKWEATADLFAQKGVRTVKIRTGVVLSKNGAAFPKIVKPAKYGLAVAFGSGKQYVPWIHISDIVGIFIKAIEDENMNGAYNGVAPDPVTNKQLIKTITKELHKPFLLPNIPSSILKLIFGEMSDILLKGSRINASKIIKAGYVYKYSDIQRAIKDLLKKET